MDIHNSAVQDHIVRLAVSIPMAAYKLSVSPRHVYTLIETGELKSFTSGRRRLISLGEIEKYIAERMEEEI